MKRKEVLMVALYLSFVGLLALLVIIVIALVRTEPTGPVPVSLPQAEIAQIKAALARPKAAVVPLELPARSMHRD